MKAPSFWYSSPRFLSTVLWPFGWLYGEGVNISYALKSQKRFPIPIFSIGNLVCGGAGKTPTALALALLLQKKGMNIHFVTRGYKGQAKGPLQVDPARHTAFEVGDEPLLLAQQAPTWVAKEKKVAVQKGIENGADIIILDDGHQTGSLYKDLSFVVVDTLQGFGNGCVLPAGPLRENLRRGLSRADGFICVGKWNVPSIKPSFRVERKIQSATIPSKKVIAFCGIGFPQKFYQSLKDEGLELVQTKSFPNHYVYKDVDIANLQHMALKNDAALVTTRKDWVRLPYTWQTQVHVLDMTFQFENPEGIYRFIVEKIPSLKGAG